MDYPETLSFLYEKQRSNEFPELEIGSRKLYFSEKTLQLAPLFPLPETDNFEEYLFSIPEDPPPYLMILIQAGAAALGYFEYGEPALHKAISAYMVRQQQGKSQIKHLNQKGKSRLGSRIR
ncbi:MAG: hypothetical protein AAF740_14595, partial [Bacteroidota bacterium]